MEGQACFALSGDRDRLNEAIDRAKNAAAEFETLNRKLKGKLNKEEREKLINNLSVLDPLSQGNIFLCYSLIEALAYSGEFLKINEFIEAFGINLLSDPYLSPLDEASILIAAKALNLDEKRQTVSCKVLSANDDISYKMMKIRASMLLQQFSDKLKRLLLIPLQALSLQKHSMMKEVKF